MRLPTFFVVGAPQAGTTSLYHYLDQHPAVYMSPIKEPCFFSPEAIDVTPRARELFDADAAPLRAYLDGALDEKRQRGWVLQWDEYRKLFKNVRTESAIGEGSVSYLASVDAPRAIRARIPEARIVMMLRDPAARLFSRYLAAQRAGERATFARWVMGQQASPDSARRIAPGSVWAGRYAVHLRRYLDHFPRAQVRVHVYDDYMKAPAGVVRDLLTFLGVDPEYPIDTARRHNVTLAPRWPKMHGRLIRPVGRVVRPLVPSTIATWARAWSLGRQRNPTPEERAIAAEIYSEDIRALETLIDRDLSVWCRRSAGL